VEGTPPPLRVGFFCLLACVFFDSVLLPPLHHHHSPTHPHQTALDPPSPDTLKLSSTLLPPRWADGFQLVTFAFSDHKQLTTPWCVCEVSPFAHTSFANILFNTPTYITPPAVSSTLSGSFPLGSFFPSVGGGVGSCNQAPPPPLPNVLQSFLRLRFLCWFWVSGGCMLPTQKQPQPPPKPPPQTKTPQAHRPQSAPNDW